MFAFLDAKSRFEPGYIADMIKENVDANKNMKMQIINNRIPRENFRILWNSLQRSIKKKGTRPLYCQASWFEKHKFISYSVKQGGVSYLPFLPTQPTHNFRAKSFISKPYTNWKVHEIKLHDKFMKLQSSCQSFHSWNSAILPNFSDPFFGI